MKRQPFKKISKRHATPKISTIVTCWKKGTDQRSQESYLMKEFKFLLVLFRIIGIPMRNSGYQNIEYPRIHEKFIYFFWNIPQCVPFVFVFSASTQAVISVIFPDKKNTVASLFIEILLIMLYFFVRGRNQKVLQILINLDEPLKNTRKKDVREIKCILIIFLVFFIIVIGFQNLNECILPDSLMLKLPRDFCLNNSITKFLNLQEYCLVTFQATLFMFNTIGCILLSTVAILYGFICMLTAKSFFHLGNQLQTNKPADCFRHQMNCFKTISEAVKYLEDVLSFPIFLASLIAMIGLFRPGYLIAFYSDKMSLAPFITQLSSAIFYFLNQMLIMIPASIVNEQANFLMQSMFCRIPASDSKLKLDFEVICKKHASLTLWKIYVFDRSLIVASLGCLLTYGILFGTIGKVN